MGTSTSHVTGEPDLRIIDMGRHIRLILLAALSYLAACAGRGQAVEAQAESLTVADDSEQSFVIRALPSALTTG
jgi:hypothetical protein